jgi:hypothetical protein
MGAEGAALAALPRDISFNEGPVKRDTRKMRDLTMSDWYRQLWPDVVLTRTGETSFANSSPAPARASHSDR